MKFFVIGLGSIGKRHAHNLLALGHEVAIYDMIPSVVIRAKEECPELEITASGADCDAYVICTPPSEHASDLYEAATAGKHIFVEKPIEASATDEVLLKGLKVAKRKNLVVMVGNMLRFHPNVILAKQHIRHPVSAKFYVKQKNTKYTEDVILNWGAHEIDLALYLLGPGKLLDATGSRNVASVAIDHDGGLISEIYMDYVTEPEVRGFEVEDIDCTHTINLTLHDWNEVYTKEMEAFVSAVEGGVGIRQFYMDPRMATGEDGLRTLQIINDAQRMAGL